MSERHRASGRFLAAKRTLAKPVASAIPLKGGGIARAPPDAAQRVSPESPDLQFVPDAEFQESEYQESEYQESHADGTRELQFKPSDNRVVPDSCPIEAKFAAQRGVCSAEKAFWAWPTFFTAQNLAERVEKPRHLR